MLSCSARLRRSKNLSGEARLLRLPRIQNRQATNQTHMQQPQNSRRISMMSKPHKRRATGRRWLAAAASAAFMATGIALAADSVTFTAGSPGGGYFKAAAAFGRVHQIRYPGHFRDRHPRRWMGQRRTARSGLKGRGRWLCSRTRWPAWPTTEPVRPARSTTSGCWPRFASRGRRRPSSSIRRASAPLKR